MPQNDPPNDDNWKVPDPTQRRRSTGQGIDIQRLATRQSDVPESRVGLILGIVLIAFSALVVIVFIILNPGTFKNENSPGITRVNIKWGGGTTARKAFDDEWSTARRVTEDELGAFARRYLIFDESKGEGSAALEASGGYDIEQQRLWKDYLQGKDLLSAEMNFTEFLKPINTNPEQPNASDIQLSERRELTLANDVSQLPDGGMRRVSVTFQLKLGEEVREELSSLTKQAKTIRLLIAPYYIEPSTTRTTVRAIELPSEFGQKFPAMNEWVHVTTATLHIPSDLVGFEVLDSQGAILSTMFRFFKIPGSS